MAGRPGRGPPWLAASTLLELGELTAQWLEGSRAYQPFYFGGPDPETDSLVPVLAQINRAGFWTQTSQPGRPLVDGTGQRAAIDGFCSADVAGRIRRALAPTDLIVIAIEPGMYGTNVVTTLVDGEEHTWWGIATPTEVLADNYLGPLGHAAVLTLIESWQVHVIDPLWGRDDLLWRLLLDAVV